MNMTLSLSLHIDQLSFQLAYFNRVFILAILPSLSIS